MSGRSVMASTVSLCSAAIVNLKETGGHVSLVTHAEAYMETVVLKAALMF